MLCKLTLSDAEPLGGRTVNGMRSIGRWKTLPYSSLEDALKTRLKTPSTREQNDISNTATDKYLSGSKMILVKF